MKRLHDILFCTLSYTSVLLGTVIVVDRLSSSFAFAQISGEVFLLLLVVVTQQLLPVVWINTLLLLYHLSFHLLLLTESKEELITYTRILIKVVDSAF